MRSASHEEPARERIVREAARLFSENGYERTTVPDIQAASGLSPGAGGLYRHFPSKEALLEEIVLRHIASFEEGLGKLAAALDQDPSGFLELLGKGVLDEFVEARDGVRIALRDLDQFPRLLTQFRERRIQPPYQALSAWLRAQVEAGKLRDHDWKAMAVVILGSLVSVRILEALSGEPPARISERRLLSAWLDLILTGLSPIEATGPTRQGKGRRAAKSARPRT